MKSRVRAVVMVPAPNKSRASARSRSTESSDSGKSLLIRERNSEGRLSCSLLLPWLSSSLLSRFTWAMCWLKSYGTWAIFFFFFRLSVSTVDLHQDTKVLATGVNPSHDRLWDQGRADAAPHQPSHTDTTHAEIRTPTELSMESPWGEGST